VLQLAEGQEMDGRRARGIRTRGMIVDALMDLVASGDLSPTAQRVAAKAGVSVRSVYQHFNDVEGLYTDAARRSFDWIRSSAKDIDPAWPLERRIDEFVASRAAALETMSAFTRAVRMMEPSSTALEQIRLDLQRWSRDRVAYIFGPELDRMEGRARGSVLAAIDAISSAEAWGHMRFAGQSERAARQTLRASISALLSVPTH